MAKIGVKLFSCIFWVDKKSKILLVMNEQNILKYLEKTASNAEKAAIEAWLEDSPKHEEELEQMKKVWEKSEALKDYQVFDKQLAWEKVRKSIKNEEGSTTSTRTAKRIPLSTTGTTSNGYPMLRIAAMCLLFIMVGILFYLGLGGDAPSTQGAYQIVKSVNQISKVPLSDGSIVWLNQNSTLKIPTATFQDKREVVLEGEAFFDIAKDPNRPFIIETEKANIKVLGTSFNVNTSFVGRVDVTVESGKVQFYSKKDESKEVVLKKDDKGIFENNEVKKIVNNNPNFLSWKTGVLDFADEKLETILRTLSQYYQVDLRFEEGSVLPDCISKEHFNNQKLEEVLEDLKYVFQFTIIQVEGGYILSGGDCNRL